MADSTKLVWLCCSITNVVTVQTICPWRCTLRGLIPIVAGLAIRTERAVARISL